MRSEELEAKKSVESTNNTLAAFASGTSVQGGGGNPRERRAAAIWQKLCLPAGLSATMNPTASLT